jgi:transposase
MRRHANQWPDRVWAIEGCAGIGKHIAVRLPADGEEVVDVPPKLLARARVLAPDRDARPTPPTLTPSRWSTPG